MQTRKYKGLLFIRNASVYSASLKCLVIMMLAYSGIACMYMVLLLVVIQSASFCGSGWKYVILIMLLESGIAYICKVLQLLVM